MKKVILLVIVLLLVVYYGYSRYYVNIPRLVKYADVVGQSESGLSESAGILQQQSLTTMLETGIATSAGVIKSTRVEVEHGIGHYELFLNGKATEIKTVSPIELVQAFLLDGKQIILIGFDEGGNQCPRQYRFISLDGGLQATRPFGSCLPIIMVAAEGPAIILTMPQNNPYLGNDVTVSYRYKNGVITQINKPKKVDLKNKFGKLTATGILKIAAHDGCYQDGVMLDDNSCGNGQSYCTMFHTITPQKNNADYKFLQDFCTSP